MRYTVLGVAVLFLGGIVAAQSPCQGAWKSENGVLIISGDYFSYAAYNDNSFTGTKGGKIVMLDGESTVSYEFDTWGEEELNAKIPHSIDLQDEKLHWGDMVFSRLDNGAGSDLAGAWLFAGRYRDGEFSGRSTNLPRKTMKILSASRFQWIAYNTQTGEFFGTGGGSYTVKDGKYQETIAFFSRDQERVGAVLPFHYEIIDGQWHHKGRSSQGKEMHEVWAPRK